MILLHTFLDTLTALYDTDPLVVDGGLVSLLVFAYALMLGSCITLKVTR